MLHPVLRRDFEFPREHRGGDGRDIHDFVAQKKEVLAHERLGEEVRNVVRGRYEGNTETVVFYALADEIVSSVYVLRPSVMFRIVG